jgi:hypothetical protein
VSGCMKMLGGVFVLRVVAAAHVPADFAESQVYPGVANLEAVFAPVCAGGDFADQFSVAAGFRFPCVSIPNSEEQFRKFAHRPPSH